MAVGKTEHILHMGVERTEYKIVNSIPWQLKEEVPVGDATTRACWQLMHLPAIEGQPLQFVVPETVIGSSYQQLQKMNVLFGTVPQVRSSEYVKMLNSNFLEFSITVPFTADGKAFVAKTLKKRQERIELAVKAFVSKWFNRSSKVAQALAWNYNK